MKVIQSVISSFPLSQKIERKLSLEKLFCFESMMRNEIMLWIKVTFYNIGYKNYFTIIPDKKNFLKICLERRIDRIKNKKVKTDWQKTRGEQTER